MLWRRHRGTSPSLTPLQLRTSWQAISWLLDYPTEAHRLRAPGVRAAIADLPAPVREPLGDVLDAIESQPLARLQSDYVDTFDVTRRCALHLTYYTCGDTRKRGVELVRFKQAYRDAGAAYDHEELPDHLGVVLEFGATVNHAVAWKLLCDHRVGVELLARALTDRDSTWAPVLRALRATLPALDGTDEEALARLIAEGPPSEQVGLELPGYALDPRLQSTHLGSSIPVRANA